MGGAAGSSGSRLELTWHPMCRCLTGAQWCKQHPADKDHIDTLSGVLLFEAIDESYSHPIYLGNTFVNGVPMPPILQGYDVVRAPSPLACQAVDMHHKVGANAPLQQVMHRTTGYIWTSAMTWRPKK